MASYPLPSPIMIARPTTGQTYIDVKAQALQDVTAPEGGELVYVGDGTADPFKGYSPGVVVMWGARSNLLHVFGYIDRAWVDGLRTGGVWGWTGGLPEERKSLLNRMTFGVVPSVDLPVPGVIEDLNDALFGAPATTPRPAIAEGQKIGQVAPSRGYLRWTTITNGAAAQSPLLWAQQNALPAPMLEPVVQPVRPPPTAQGGGGGNLAIALGLLWWANEEGLL